MGKTRTLEQTAAAGDVPATEFDVPDAIIADAGRCFDYCISQSYPRHATGSIPRHFNVSRQTFWVWRQPRNGVPSERRDTLKALIDSRDEPFRLGRNITLDHLINKSAKKVTGAAGSRNDALLVILTQIVSGNHPPMSRSTLELMIETHMYSIRSPHVFWQWAYCNGGIPSTYVSQFIKAMIQTNVPAMLDMTPQDFRSHALKTLVAQPELFEDEL